MTVQDLIRSKSDLLLRLEDAKARHRKKEARALASWAAALEGQIADHLLKAGRLEDALVNLVSEASCLHEAARHTEAARILDRALDLTQRQQLRVWIESFRRGLQTGRRPAEVFAVAHVAIAGNTALRRPQIEAYRAVKEHFSRSSQHAIVQLPVGCGKTGTMAILPFDVSRGRVLVLAPNLEIAGNLYRNMNHSAAESFWRKTGVLSNGSGPTCAILHGEASILDADESDIVVANIQQLVAKSSEKWLSQFSPDYFDMILIDEGHHNVAESWRASTRRFPDARLVSFTATPLRADGKRVEGTRVYHFPIADAIREGLVRDIAARRLEPVSIYFEYKGDRKQHSLAEVLALREKDWFSKGVALSPECNRHIVDASIQCMNELRVGGTIKHQIIAAACSIDHAKAIRSLYAERGCRADVLHSDLPDDAQARVRHELSAGVLDVIVHVQMLGEGADYPGLGVAALFRPYRHLVPYVQFVGRVMRVAKQNAPGDPDNRAFVVSHAGLNVDRWWEELRELDKGDQDFFEALAQGARGFGEDERPADQVSRRRFTPSMQVIKETIEHFVQEHFLAEDSKAVVDDLVRAFQVRGIAFEDLGVSREDLERRLLDAASKDTTSRGAIASTMVQPQAARLEARKRLEERVRSGAKELLNELTLTIGGFEIPRAFPETGTINNLAGAIVLLNQQVKTFLQVESDSRDILATDQLRSAHDAMDSLVDAVAKLYRAKRGQDG